MVRASYHLFQQKLPTEKQQQIKLFPRQHNRGENSSQTNMDNNDFWKLKTHTCIIETDPTITAVILQNGTWPLSHYEMKTTISFYGIHMNYTCNR